MASYFLFSLSPLAPELIWTGTFLEHFPFPISSLGSTLIFGPMNVGLLSHTQPTETVRCSQRHHGWLSQTSVAVWPQEKSPLSRPQEAAHLWVWGISGQLFKHTVGISDDLGLTIPVVLNAWPSIHLRASLAFLLDLEGPSRIQVVQWCGFILCLITPIVGTPGATDPTITTQTVRAATE